ncbi:uncharacterized protein LOC5512430 [Nematostella vectensis]|uniref:uncharacterized protein LOC5512430 n=1 Tax=Nematostella vectensis TaxID=45351 RepID=UPI0020779BB2|nr:uncharacterized protein LOC5512430 [Nematostella vectensis]
MASVSNLSKEKGTTDFPSSEFLSSLLASYPTEWQGVFGALNSNIEPISNAAFWLEMKISAAKYEDKIPPFWSDFLKHLKQEYPVVLDNEINFKPKLFLLPLNLQRNVLSFITENIEKIPSEFLKTFVEELLVNEKDLHIWTSTLLRVLRVKIEQAEQQKKGILDTVYFTQITTEHSRSKLDKLCDRIRETRDSVDKMADIHLVSIDDIESYTKLPLLSASSSSNADYIDQIQTDFQSCDTIRHARIDDGENASESKESELLSPTSNSPKTVTKAIDAEIPIKKRKLDDAKADIIKIAPDDAEILDIDENTTSDPVEPFIKEKGEALKQLCLTLSDAGNTGANEELNALESFLELPTDKLETICRYAYIECINEQVFCILCQMFLSLPSEPSFANTCTFARCCILPQLRQLNQAASRILITAVISFAKKNPKPLCEAVFAPLIKDPSFNTFQAETICRILKDAFCSVSSQHLLSFIVKEGAPNTKYNWSEEILTVIQAILESKPVFEEGLYSSFLQTLDNQSARFSKSLKFSKMLLEVINKNKQLAAGHRQLLLGITERCETFLKKALITAVKKLKE